MNYEISKKPEPFGPGPPPLAKTGDGYEAGASNRTTANFERGAVIEFSVAERQKKKGRKPLGSGPENLLEYQVYGPEILAAKTTNWISTQQVIMDIVYHEYRPTVNAATSRRECWRLP